MEIDFYQVAKKIWHYRKTVYKTVLVFVIIGLIVAFGSKVEYEASCKLLPEKKEGALSNLGGLSGFVGLTGINLDFGSQSTISPELYPQIVESLPFQLKVIHKDLLFEGEDEKMTSYTYFREVDNPSFLGYIMEYTFGLPEKIRKLFSDEDEEKAAGTDVPDVADLSKRDVKLIERFKNRISVDADPETGVILVEAEMPDPVAAAELTQACVDLLLEYIVDHKVKKVKKNHQFIQKRYADARKKYEEAQKNLENIAFAKTPADKQRVQDEYDLAYETFKSVTTQLDQIEIKLEEETPVFTVIEPVNVPIEKSKPKRTLILLAGIFLGVIAGSLIVLIKY